MLHENFRKRPQKPVSFRKPVCLVIELQVAEIHKQQHRFFSAFLNDILSGDRKIKEVRHVRKTGQIVVMIGFDQAFFMQGIAERQHQTGAGDL